MKKLTKIKLINWHYLTNVTIDIHDNCLITGDNGSGKSTILDAIQYVLTGGRARFNSAAHEKAKRDLLGYVRCKTGKDTNAYERKGDVTAHVALEFYEESKKRSFVLGAVIDSSSDLSNPKVIFYRIVNQKIEDKLFLNGAVPKNISQFKVSTKSFQTKILPTQTAAREDFNHSLGSIGHRFFELLPKALAFKAIENVKDFVYSYILDEKEVNIDYLKENVRTYMDFERVLEGIKQKLERLEEIQKEYEEVLRVEENIRIHDYIILKSQKDTEEEKLKSKNMLLSKRQEQSSKEKESEVQHINQLDLLKERESDIRKSLLTNDTYQLMRSLEHDIKLLENSKRELDNEQQGFMTALQTELDRMKKIHGLNIEIKGLKDFVERSQTLDNPPSVGDFCESAFVLEESFNEVSGQFNENLFKLKSSKEDKEKQLRKVNEEIQILDSKKLVHNKEVIALQRVIGSELEKLEGKRIEAKIICELLEVSDPIWQDAVEGYLNTQRFNLLVDPQYFDDSLHAYERYKKSNGIHGVGLINTQQLEKYQECDENSLAAVVTSKNKYAKYYINMVLGKVIRCDAVENLKKYQRSITPTCMVYQNHTARQINPQIYKKPYIGSEAYKKQLVLKVEEQKQLKEVLLGLGEEIEKLNEIMKLMIKPRFEYLREHSDVQIKVNQKHEEIGTKQEELKRIDRSTIMELDLELESIKKTIDAKEKELKTINGRVIRLDFEMEQLEKEINQFEDRVHGIAKQIINYETQHGEILDKANERYQAGLKLRKPYDIHQNFTRSRQGLDTKLNNAENELMYQQRQYNNDYHFGGAEGKAGMEDFNRENKVLRESKVIEYEEKINGARQKAEEEFKEHFISKLQENIVSAQNEFKKLNQALKGIQFGQDEYKFYFSANKQYDKFYRMIMDENNLGGNTLFTGVYRQKHKEAMEELFERITVDNDESRKALEKFTDYRTFMDYDIKIYHSDGSTSSFAKVCREKSGGETQTPYYVAIAASFVQLYDSGIHQDKLGIILLDEAFDKMDENRIDSMMSFFSKLDLQLLIASPPQKIETIGPHVGTTLVVTKEDNFSWVEAFRIDEEL
ncbi:MukB N-terminal domain/M protein repeat protein [Alkaliphilus metalliredigens QYMF]|uniref:MukB N-terminal domain/M protein repeat protein n=1 Tax=Alkaliphilus metalliredigens (strain QYMF) TaxID=293826 RepID=A6TQ43_ALKMQ|nr:SbcC/MukB-like Walker B domain-containing protein [Alkaliphilus metalliredigens]ABR48311.1 MukB N-terminal domain/M protein repeat protein [Alkaliphilus metalliredigens QYMF]